MMRKPHIVCVVGKKKSGKTTTVIGLVREFSLRGYRVMSAKHGHDFDLDTYGTDSWRHRHEAGACRVVMAGPQQIAVMGEWDVGGEQQLETLVSKYLSDADIVVAEGFQLSSAARVEVFRRAAHRQPIYGTDARGDALYLAVLVWMGYFFSKRERTTQDFFTASGRIPWWAAGLRASICNAVYARSVRSRSSTRRSVHALDNANSPRS